MYLSNRLKTYEIFRQYKSGYLPLCTGFTKTPCLVPKIFSKIKRSSLHIWSPNIHSPAISVERNFRYAVIGTIKCSCIGF